MIIYDEYQYSKHLLETKVKKILQRDLNYLAKYWMQEGFKRDKIEKNLIKWCLNQDSNFNPSTYKNIKRIKKALQHANKILIRPVISIAITQSELEVIKSINDYKLEKVVFVMLATARFYKYTETRKKPSNAAKLIGTYFNNPFIDAVKIAGVSMNLNQRDEARFRLRELGLIDPILSTKNIYKREPNYRLNFSDETGFPVILINDWRNIIAYYQEYKGEKIIHCEDCGMMIRQRNKNHKKCSICFKKNRGILQKQYNKSYVEKLKRA